MSKKINVLQLMTDSKIGGAERVVLQLSKGLDINRFTVSICCLAERGPIFDEAEEAGIKIYSLGIKNRWDFLKILRLVKILKKLNIHILHAHLFHANILSRIIGKISNVPIIISTEHIMGMESSLRILVNRLTSTFVTKYIVVSEAVGGFLNKNVKIRPCKISTVLNGIEYNNFKISLIAQEKLKEQFGLTTSQEVIGTIARLHRQKGHIYLLHAITKVVKVFPNAKFLVVGDGPLKYKLEELAHKLGIGNNVIFTGNQKDISTILSLINIFVLPSLWEGLPITILEAMAMKKPVVVTNVSGNPEVVIDNITGILVPPKEPTLLAEAILRLLRDKGLSLKLGEAGYQRGKEKFSKEQMIAKTAMIYDELLKEKHLP